MKRPIFLSPLVLTGLIFFFFQVPLGAESFSDHLSWSFMGSILVIPEDNDLKGDPSPVLLAPGTALAYSIWGPLSAELSLDIYSAFYGYRFDLNRAVPYAMENRSASVWDFITGLQVLAKFSPLEKLTLRAYGGPSADLRIIALAPDLHPDDFSGKPESDAQIQTDAVREYFWSQGRWFLPVAGVGADFPINEKFLLGLDFRTWFPLYRLWSGEDLPPIEGWRFGVGVRITIR
jgi:hypothetical protein